MLPIVRFLPWLLLVGTSHAFIDSEAVLPEQRAKAASQVEEMFDHAFTSYMKYAFPADELRPLSCDGRVTRERGDLDAVIGNFSLTLIDALDALVIFRRHGDFARAVKHIEQNVDFDKDLEVSTFEANIRLLGGLLSGHMHATRLMLDYKDGLLLKAVDLAKRLKPAFNTPTRLPLSRINLRHGRPMPVSPFVTIAEAGSFLLEFGMVSLLTGDSSFYDTAKAAVLAFWQRRSALGLVGTTIDVNTGHFQDSQSTTGPGQDSFYEYLLKAYTLFDDLELLEMFLSAYSSVERYHSFEGFTYTVDMYRGLMANTHLSPLSCVWASLQALAGDIAGALRTVLYWFTLWQKHDALPEVFDLKAEAPATARDSPMRPELIEAVFYVSQALPGDPMVFKIAQSMANALDKESRVECGFASLGDVVTKTLDDRMDSFFLSETLVYLYLVLAPPKTIQEALPWPLSSVVFTTEGHIFPLPQAGSSKMLQEATGRSHSLFPSSASHRPLSTCESLSPFERVSVQQRCRFKYIQTSSLHLQRLGHTSQRCRAQEVIVQLAEGSRPTLRFSGMASTLGPPVPALPELHQRESGNRAKDPTSKVPVEANSSLLLGQDALALPRLDLDQPPGAMPSFTASSLRHSELRELFATRSVVEASPLDACSFLQPGPTGPAPEANATVDPDSDIQERTFTMFDLLQYYWGRIAVVRRGTCLFKEKLERLQSFGAVAVIVINQDDATNLQVMTCPLQEHGTGKNLNIPAIMVSSSDGEQLLALLRQQTADKAVTACIYALH